MEIDDKRLKERHPEYKKRIETWKSLAAVYAGIDELIALAKFKKHERESIKNFNRRLRNIYGYNFSASVVNLLSFFLFKAQSVEDFQTLSDDVFFQMFLDDADYQGRSFQQWLILAQKQASIFGSVGILVDRPMLMEAGSRQEQIDQRIYANVSYYTPINVLNWDWETNEQGRKILTFLLLQDTDGLHRVWTLDQWMTFQITNKRLEKIDEGPNPLGEIPFFWQINEDIGSLSCGRSDIDEIARVDLSIINNTMQIEQIIDYAAFPMLMLPDEYESESGTEVSVGITATLRFDPKEPGSKPEWLRQEASDIIKTTMDLINEKIRNIYRTSNLSGVTTNMSSQVRSGESLKREFQLLNAKLVSKSCQVENAEKSIIRLWGLWQNIDTADIIIKRPKDFDVESLAEELDTILTARELVQSTAFDKILQKRIARQLIGREDESVIAEVDGEIEASNDPAPVTIDSDV